MILKTNKIKENPFVVVLILSYNGKSLLEEAISSYLQNNYSNFKIVVIDNGSEDGTEKYVKSNFRSVEVLRLEKNVGYSGGFNHGIDYAIKNLNADYVLLSNNDVKVDGEAVGALVRTAQLDEKIGFVTGKVYYYERENGKNIIQTIGKESHPIFVLGDHIGSGIEDLGQYDKVSERDFCDDVFILVKRSLILEVGKFDETFFFQYEECDWQSRAKKQGYKIYYTPDAKIWHKVGKTTGGTDSPIRHYNGKKNIIIFIRRNGTPLQFSLALFLHIFYYLPIWSLSFIMKGRFDLVSFSFRGFISGLIWSLRNRKEITDGG